MSYEVCCLYAFFFVYHILSYSFGSIFYHIYIYIWYVLYAYV